MTIKSQFDQLQQQRYPLPELIQQLDKFLQWEVCFRLKMVETNQAYNLLSDKWVFDGVYPVTSDDELADELVGQYLCSK